jgi:hypothetical protein
MTELDAVSELEALSELDARAVTALQFTEVAIADDLAAWCSGEVTRRVDVEGSPDELTVILIPTSKGPKAAHVGDWIVRRAEGDYYPCTPEKFALLHEPIR